MHHSYIDRFAQGSSPIHRLDAQSKLLAILAYTAVLISFDRYAVSMLAPMAVLPVAMLLFAGIPLSFALRRVLILSPFILATCLLAPLYDHSLHHVHLANWQGSLSGGWLTLIDVAVKFTLGVLALTALISTTPFGLLLEALRKFHVPKLLVMQLGFLYRYIFVLIDESMRIRRARDFRGAVAASVPHRLRAVGGIIGSLFVRTLERSDRVYMAMLARGYDGQNRSLSVAHFHSVDALFLVATVGYLIFCRALYPRIV
jgi:cobalt/nickel transport system permease protein